MAIQYRSTPKRKATDRGASAILTREDFEDAVAAVNMTLADIAKATGINRQYLSEFKCGDRNLRPDACQTLRDFFEAKGVEFVDTEPDDDFEAEGEDSTRLAARAKDVVENIKRIAAGKLIYDDVLLFEADEPDEGSMAEHQQLIGLLAEFALLQFRIQGNDLAPPLTPQLAEAGARLTTHAELLAREFPWPTGEPNPAPASNSSEKSLAAGTEGEAQERGQTQAKPAPEKKSGLLID
ncbi:MAG: helix-turn-helix transcriptional regulator [Betaproteobacteria bacterium]|nr:helix-turn-helix transcriptional regulator [Betaproteobacteria bacterium]